MTRHFVKQSHKTLLLWVLLIMMFLAIWQFLSPEKPPPTSVTFSDFLQQVDNNADPRFARVRVRHELIPQLESMAPGVVEHLGDLADMLAALLAGADPALAELGKGQRKTVERARKRGQRGVTLRVSGGRDVEVTFSDRGAVLIQDR